MINRDFIDKANSNAKPGVFGVLSIGGFPGNYTLRAGLTGPTIAKGTPSEIQEAIGLLLWIAPSVPLEDR
jgi:hypothetical protein